jgi:iron complex transport system permease protein
VVTAVGVIDPSAPVRAVPSRLRLVPTAVCIAIAVAAMIVGATVGSAGLPLRGVLASSIDHLPFIHMHSGLTDAQTTILWQIRMPRVVLGALVGGTLSISGAAYQGVFRNPLADPYLLGVAAGAGMGATFVIVSGTATGSLLPIAAFVGGLVGVFLTYTLGRSGYGGRTTVTLVLAGVSVTSFLTAVQTYVQQRNATTLRQVYTWILGRLTTATWGQVRLVLPYMIVSIAVLMLHRRLLDVLAVGDEHADSLGVRSSRVRLIVVVGATLGTAAAVACSGLIGFVGIIVPHLTRLMFGVSNRIVIPLSFLLGAAFLVLTDSLARTITAPGELPIGVITAFFGAPFFALVLRASRRGLS